MKSRTAIRDRFLRERAHLLFSIEPSSGRESSNRGTGQTSSVGHARLRPSGREVMSLWHAEIDPPDFVNGAKVTLLSDHRIVSVVTADTLSIETPSGQKFSGVVEDRTGSDIRLILADGQPISLEMVVDESIHPPTASNYVFARQVWTAH